MRESLRLCSLSIVFLAVLPGGRTAEPDPAPDPWTGKTRADLVTLLGEPDKTKKAGTDGSMLIYKLARVAEGMIAPPSMVSLDVPGIGVVARPLDAISRFDPDVNFEPTSVDEQGRPTGGGLTEQQTSNIEWKDGERITTQPGEDRSALRGKLTLKVELDGAGTIRSWSVSPKKARR